MDKYYVHETAVVDEDVTLEDGVKIWHFCHVRTGATLSENVSLGKGVFIDEGVELGKGTRIQNGVSIYRGIKVGQWCFVGPNVTFTNDMTPRVGKKEWKVYQTSLADGASIGAGSIIVCGVSIGRFAMVGAGSVVSSDVPDFCLSYGLPARVVSRICACGDSKLPLDIEKNKLIQDCCEKKLSGTLLDIAKEVIKSINE